MVLPTDVASEERGSAMLPTEQSATDVGGRGDTENKQDEGDR